MRLTTEQSCAMLERFGCYVKNVCDRCGHILGPVRYTRRGELGNGARENAAVTLKGR